MVTLILDVMRSSVTKHQKFDVEQPYTRDNTQVYTPVDMPAVPKLSGSPPLMMYVMPHFVGNAPASWRRQFYGDVSHTYDARAPDHTYLCVKSKPVGAWGVQ